MSVIVDGSLFQSCIVIGKNDLLYTVTLVYGTKRLCDLRVLLSFDWTMDSDSGISTKWLDGSSSGGLEVVFISRVILCLLEKR